MPELPEVETVRKYLKIATNNETILDVKVLDKRIPFKSELDLNLLIGQKIIDINRKGKYLLFIFNDYVMVSHLRMEGKYYIYNYEEKDSSHARVIFKLTNNKKLIYDDVRRFGTMELYKKDAFDISKCLKNVGEEPFTYNKDLFYKNIHDKNIEIKTLLMDQSIISGIGNIYADEILFKAYISPFKRAKNITKEEADRILEASISVLNESIKQGGTTIRSYHPSRNVDGRFQQKLNAYNMVNKPCVRCNSLMRKRNLHGRGTTYCPKCQKVAKIIGIYGKIASGKSTLLNMFKKENYPIFSADDEVDLIYKNDLNFTLKCVELFHEECLNEHLKVSKEYIKQVVIKDEEKKKQLESLIHPIVIKKMHEFIKKNMDKELIVLEIPLLFEAKLNTFFDYIIGVDASLLSQREHLKIRNSKSISNDLLLNNSSNFDLNKHKCNYIIKNDGTLLEFENAFLEVLKVIKSI